MPHHNLSLFGLFTAGLAFLTPLTNAYTTPKGDKPEGNPISAPGLNSMVPVGKSYNVTWKPTTPGTVSLVLLKGPSTNAMPQYAIAERIPNTGLFDWTPGLHLPPSENATGYGIQLIDDSTGKYQYTTQFGIANPDWPANPPSPSASWDSNQDHKPPGPLPSGNLTTCLPPPSHHGTAPPRPFGWTRANLSTPTFTPPVMGHTSALPQPWANTTHLANVSSASIAAARQTNAASAPASAAGVVGLGSLGGLVFGVAVAVLVL